VTDLSKAISYLLHPLMMATYASAIYLFLLPTPYTFADERVPYFLVGLIATGTFMLPAFFSLLMLRMGKIKSLQMETIGERNWPLVFTVLIYFGVLYVLHNKFIPSFIQIFVLGATASMIVALIINLRWKISLHMIGAGGMCGAIAGNLMVTGEGPVKLLAGLVIISGGIASARHYLGTHTLAQLFIGYISGFAILFSLMALLLVRI
jgi:hypothetical protein